MHEILENLVLHSIARAPSQSVDMSPFSECRKLCLLPQRVLWVVDNDTLKALALFLPGPMPSTVARLPIYPPRLYLLNLNSQQ